MDDNNKAEKVKSAAAPSAPSTLGPEDLPVEPITTAVTTVGVGPSTWSSKVAAERSASHNRLEDDDGPRWPHDGSSRTATAEKISSWASGSPGAERRPGSPGTPSR